ncbi:hypothetical protein BDR22DRAFT_967190 [Usnea florida]
MPTNRPFFFNFLAAFRAQTALPKSTSTTASTPTTAPQPTNPYTPPTLSLAIPTSKSPSTAAVQAATSLSHARQPSSASPTGARSPPPSTSRSPPPSGPFRRRARRGSDTSSEGGVRDLSEKWYVGGKTVSGEERYLRLGMVRKERSGDRLSLDRLSL